MTEDLVGEVQAEGTRAPWGAQRVDELSDSVNPHHNRTMDRRPGAGRAGRGLELYRARRAASRTPEPFDARTARPRLFVVQQHRARRLHYDLRLEWDGVLLSWAVPKGPSLDPAEKHLAVHVEDHPLDYADFEGVIPEGNYGAGAVIVWDLGRWTPLEDPERGLATGKLDFVLQGHKLRGRFALVRTGGRRAAAAGGKEWLLLKKRDAFAASGARLPPHSVLSGLTIEERAAGLRRDPAFEKRLTKLGAPRARVRAAEVRLMRAEPWPAPFAGRNWLFEVKYDGWRVVAEGGSEGAWLRTRGGQDASTAFPEIVRALRALPCAHAVLDGEVVVADAEGRPSFAALQQRAQLGDARGAERAAVEQPAVLYAFDLLGFGDRDLRPLPLARRRELLAALLPGPGPLRVADAFRDDGPAVYAAVCRLGFEGVVAKRAESPYRAGRDPAWRKIASHRTGDFAIVGWTVGRGARAALGALHLAARAPDGGLVYVGRAGSGLDDAALRTLGAELAPLAADSPRCQGAPARARGDRWVEPRLVAEVRYSEGTRDGRLRQPVFLRLRDDKSVAEIDAPPGPRRSAPPPDPATKAPQPVKPPTVRRLALTNLEKVFWPDEGLTKGDLLAYYRAIAPWLLPYLKDRPLTLVRHPDGIAGKAFFQKDAPAWAPAWVRRETLWSEHGGREIRFFVCEDVESLLFVVNLGAIPLHVQASRVADLAHPDWCILDLDPKGAPFRDVVTLARALHALAEEIGLPSYLKTSGSSGLHVLVPLGGRLTFEQARTLAELLAQVVVAQHPEIATRVRRVGARGGRVYVDTGQNGHGKLLVAPFSARALPGAPVSMPLRWAELGPRLDPRRFTIRNAVARMRRLGADPLAPVLGPAPDLLGALARLAQRVR
jgi:bifunctional non-homologous end joining protein LigD